MASGEQVFSGRGVGTKVFVPPTPTTLAGLGVLATSSLAALSVELAGATASPVGVRVGFLAAMLVAIAGVVAVLYCVEMRRVFIDACTSEAEDLLLRVQLKSEHPGLGIERLGELSSLLRETAAREDAQEVDEIRRSLLSVAGTGELDR